MIRINNAINSYNQMALRQSINQKNIKVESNKQEEKPNKTETYNKILITEKSFGFDKYI